MCIDVSFILAYVTIGSYVSHVSIHYTFATVYKMRHCHYLKEMPVIYKPVHVAVRLQLLEMSSTTTLNQIIVYVCTRYIFQSSFLGKILAILPICDNEKKICTAIACKLNRFNF